MKKIYILFVAVLVTTFSFAQVNGGFEDWTAGAPDGWAVDFNTTDLTENTVTVVEGSKSAKINLMTDQQGSTDMRQSVAMTAGTTYDVSLQVYATDNQARVRIFQAAGYSPSVYSDDTILNEWQTISFEYTATADADVEFGIRFYDTAANWTGTGSIFYIDDFTIVEQTGPSIVITSPADGVTVTENFDVSYTVQNFNIANGSGDTSQDGHVHWTVNGANTQMIYDPSTADFTVDISSLADGVHTLRMFLVDNTHAEFNPTIESTITFNKSSINQVGDIAALRAGTIGEVYELTGEAFINYAQTFRNQKWIQDGTAGILIDDNSDIITAGDRGDGLSGIQGTLGEYKGMLQFVPLADATVVSPSTLTITPQTVTLADLTNNFEDYEAELVKVENVMLDNSVEANYVNGKVYGMTSGADAFNFRTSFYDVDYIGDPVHTTAVTIVGLPGEKTGSGGSDYGTVISARDNADFITTASTSNNTIDGFAMYPNPVNGDVLNITTAQNLDKDVKIFDILGKNVLSKTVTGSTLNISTLNAGIYIIKVEEANNTATSKLVIK